MSLVNDIGQYLAGQSLGLSYGASGNLFNTPFPESAPDASVCIIEYASVESIRCMGASVSAPVAEVRRFQVVVRDVLDNFATAQSLAQSICNLLDHLGTWTGATSGARYLNITALQMPFYIGEDDNHRHQFSCNYEALKERG